MLDEADLAEVERLKAKRVSKQIQMVQDELARDSHGVLWSTPQAARLSNRIDSVGVGIEQLKAENARLRAALEAFVVWHDQPLRGRRPITLSDTVDTARAVLEETRG